MKPIRTSAALVSPFLLLFACSSESTPGGAGDAAAAAGADGGGVCSSISCHVAAENLCDDYAMPTATQCADVPVACSTRKGTVAKPAACPMVGFTAKCVMPGPGGYVLRFYGPRGDSSDQSFCTGIAAGTWSTTF